MAVGVDVLFVVSVAMPASDAVPAVVAPLPVRAVPAVESTRVEVPAPVPICGTVDVLVIGGVAGMGDVLPGRTAPLARGMLVGTPIPGDDVPTPAPVALPVVVPLVPDGIPLGIVVPAAAPAPVLAAPPAEPAAPV